MCWSHFNLDCEQGFLLFFSFIIQCQAWKHKWHRSGNRQMLASWKYNQIDEWVLHANPGSAHWDPVPWQGGFLQSRLEGRISLQFSGYTIVHCATNTVVCSFLLSKVKSGLSNFQNLCLSKYFFFLRICFLLFDNKKSCSFPCLPFSLWFRGSPEINSIHFSIQIELPFFFFYPCES